MQRLLSKPRAIFWFIINNIGWEESLTLTIISAKVVYHQAKYGTIFMKHIISFPPRASVVFGLSYVHNGRSKTDAIVLTIYGNPTQTPHHHLSSQGYYY